MPWPTSSGTPEPTERVDGMGRSDRLSPSYSHSRNVRSAGRWNLPCEYPRAEGTHSRRRSSTLPHIHIVSAGKGVV